MAGPPRTMVGRGGAEGLADAHDDGLWCRVKYVAAPPRQGLAGTVLSSCWEVPGLWFCGRDARGAWCCSC